MINFHFCNTFRKKIEGQIFEEFIFSKINELSLRSELKSNGSLACFSGSLYALKTSKPQTRTIIEEKNVFVKKGQEVKVFFVRDIVANTNFDYTYGKVIFPQLKSGEWSKINPLSLKDEEDFKRDYQEKMLSDNEDKEFPSSTLTRWLDDFKLNLNNNIFETEEWVKYALNDSEQEGMNDNYVNTFRLVIDEIIKLEIVGEEIKVEKGIQILKYQKHNIGVIYSKIDEVGIAGPAYILYNGAHLDTQQEHWQGMLNYFSEYIIEFNKDINSISRVAFRSYPRWTIEKDELWFSIQKNSEMSNLSLTREQTSFFKTFKFPYYINGQAGSGKSTMLYYLFSNAYFYKCHDEFEGDLIFLTENEILLDHTKNAVFDLLTNNPEFNGLSISNKNDAKKHFASFKKFLVNILPKEERFRFKESKYLNFAGFKYLYENSNLPKHIIKKYTAEESWFTIITYIYGYDSLNVITSETYLSTVARGSQIIPVEKFKGIEENVLPFYEKLLNEEDYWDKLKIIRYIDENIIINTKYSVVICDEAQDFCRVELRFILRLSEYLKYDLSKTEQVPIIFAGDPNQTVNPTGFRQDEMTSMLYEELKQISSFNYNSKKNVYNPTYNYRSAQPVVSLANFIQYFRMKNLGIKQVRPQIAKRPNPSVDKDFNVFFNYEDVDTNQDLKQGLLEKLKYKIFIVPVDSKEKESFIQRHNFLTLIDNVEVKTSVESKGAEYEQVVLVGFGEYFVNNFDEISSKNEEEQFKRRYFFNKLYVGLTRAQSELIIIDSKESKELFWDKLIEEINVTTENWKSLEDFKSNTIVYNPESISHIIKSTLEDAFENAHKDKDQGFYDSNPGRLKVAANQFFKIGDKEEGYECLALSEQIKGNWKAASDYFLMPELNGKKLEEAANCLFIGRYFNELIKIGTNLKSEKQNIRIIISRLIGDEKLMKQDIDVLLKSKRSLYNTIKNIDWRDELISQFILKADSIKIIEQKKDYIEVLESIVTSCDIGLWKKIGSIHFDLGNYQEAINSWNEIDYYEDNEHYVIAHLKIARRKNDFENIILWLDEHLKYKSSSEYSDIFNEIISIYVESNINISNVNVYLIVYKAYLIEKPYEEIDVIGEDAEKSFKNNLENLILFYEELLKEYELDLKIANSVIVRWAKTNWKKNNKEVDSDWLIHLNLKYSSILERFNIRYQEFNMEELESISEFPQEISWNPPKHFKNIIVKNFRKFSYLELSNIGQFNLIVGDNNVGKTSLLESLLFTNDADAYFENLTFAYVERKKITRILLGSEERYNITKDDIVDDFFRKNASKKEIHYQLFDNRNYWSYSIQKPTVNQIKKDFNLSSSINANDFINFSSGDQNRVIEIPFLLKNLTPLDSIKSPFIPFGKGFGEDLAQVYFDEIENKKQVRNDFLNLIRTFIPNIERINANTVKGEISIEETGVEEPAPLHQYGEGANKLFRILVQITLQKEKRILIDEIDAGIHYSRFKSFWSVILRIAKRNNVQIFATTHNMECVKYFKEILKENADYQDQSRVITLRQLPDDKIKAYTRDFVEFEYEIENDLEIRGGDL
jgi:AAA15 family ATPase/GTPase